MNYDNMTLDELEYEENFLIAYLYRATDNIEFSKINADLEHIRKLMDEKYEEEKSLLEVF